MRHVAKEGRMVVVGCCQALRKDDIPDTFAFKEKYLSSVETWINPGGSVIVDPDGKIVAGPATETETILYASFRADELVGPRWQLDISLCETRRLRTHCPPPAESTDPHRGRPAGR
jgi:nitrilase